MKKFFYLMSLCLGLFAGAAVMTSCGDDDLEGGEIKAGITEKGNTLTLTYKNAYATCTETATFDSNDKCIKYIEATTYSSKDVANQAWDAEMQYVDADEKARYKKDGKTITYDATEEFKGVSKSEIRQYMERFLEEVKQWNEQY